MCGCCRKEGLLRQPPTQKTTVERKAFEFTLFPELPAEIRAMIWHFTLEPRIVKLLFSGNRGFYSSTKTPTALQVSQDSRSAVATSYPTSFGREFFKPQIRFNFSRDTLYFENYMDVEIHHFFGALSKFELLNIQSIAVDSRINVDWETYEDNPIDYIDFFRKNARAMVDLKEFRLVQQAELFFSRPIPEGSGPMKFYQFLPDELRDCWFIEFLEDDDDDDDEYMERLMQENIEPPNFDDELATFDFPAKRENVWGWTPTSTS